MLVFAAFLLFLFQLFNVAMTSLQYHGNSGSRNENIATGMLCLTTLPAFAAMIWFGRQRGSRHGLWLIAGLAGVMAWSAFTGLTKSGVIWQPHPDRVPDLAELFKAGSLFSWAAFVVFAGLAVGSHLLRRRARHTESGSAA